MTTQGNEPSGDLTYEAGTAPAPATGETAATPSASPEAPAGDEVREPDTATAENPAPTSTTGEDQVDATATEQAPVESTGASQGLNGSPAETQVAGASQEQLVSPEAAMDFKARWEAIQQGFVDDPRSAVSDADSLVSDVLSQLSAGFDEQHRQLEGQWSNGEPDTEGLRSALQRYRDFFDRLLTI